MADVIEKDSNTTLKVTTTETVTTVNRYDYDFLKLQAIKIQSDIDRNTLELQNVLRLIQEADNLGVKSASAIQANPIEEN